VIGVRHTTDGDPQGITDSATEKIAIHGSIAAAQFIRAVAPLYNIPVIVHTDHCRTAELGWLDGMLDMDEAYFESNGEPLFSSHMIDLSSENKAANIAVTTQYFKRMAPLNLWLEMVTSFFLFLKENTNQ
jgi:fructose-bisphosphate aldolase, class II